MVDSIGARALTPHRLNNPFLAAASTPAQDVAAPRELVTLSSAAEAPPSRHLGRFAGIGAAVALGLSMLGVASPAAAQVVAPPQTTQSQTVQAQPLAPGGQAQSQPAAQPRIPITTGPAQSDTIPPPLLPEARPADKVPLHMFTGAVDHFGISSRSQSDRGEHFTYGQVEVGRTFKLNLDKGPWRSETFLDASGQARLGIRQGDAAANGTASLTVGENLSRDLGSGFSAYGRASIGIQGGLGTQFMIDEPLNAMRYEGAIGVQHTDGVTTIFAEPFAQKIHDMRSNGIGHDRVGIRVGADHMISERDAVQLELNTSHYSYTNGMSTDGFGGSLGWLHKQGNVWWGPSVGVEHRTNGDNRVAAGIQIKF